MPETAQSGLWDPRDVYRGEASGTWPAADATLGGMQLVMPTSIATTGAFASASINHSGSVTFNACETVALNGVFTAEYDNYKIIIRHGGIGTGGGDVRMRLRVSGTDSTATTDYNFQLLKADATSVTGSRVTTQGNWNISGVNTLAANGISLDIYAPFLSSPTAFRSVNVCRNPDIQDHAGTHELSTSYDGFNIVSFDLLPTDGLISVYGLVGA